MSIEGRVLRWSARILFVVIVLVAFATFEYYGIERKWFDFWLETVVAYAGSIRFARHWDDIHVRGAWLFLLSIHILLGVVILKHFQIDKIPGIVQLAVIGTDVMVVGVVIFLIEFKIETGGPVFRKFSRGRQDAPVSLDLAHRKRRNYLKRR